MCASRVSNFSPAFFVSQCRKTVTSVYIKTAGFQKVHGLSRKSCLSDDKFRFSLPEANVAGVRKFHHALKVASLSV